MKASAPGKIVLSGAYSVLRGAPSIVIAVNRYAHADTERTPEWISPEVKAAFGGQAIPHADASALRTGDRKLGLGSSAAVLVASMAAAQAVDDEELSSLRARLQEPALTAHRTAQGGGSGVDVVTSIWGGTLIAQKENNFLRVEQVSLPDGMVIEVWASPYSTSTAAMLGAVEELRVTDPQVHGTLFAQLTEAATGAAEALRSGDKRLVAECLNRQREQLLHLGQAAGAPIITRETTLLANAAKGEGAVVLPAGAGGGDIVLWVSNQSSSASFSKLASRLEHQKLDLTMQAEGVHLNFNR